MKSADRPSICIEQLINRPFVPQQLDRADALPADRWRPPGGCIRRMKKKALAIIDPSIGETVKQTAPKIDETICTLRHEGWGGGGGRSVRMK